MVGQWDSVHFRLQDPGFVVLELLPGWNIMSHFSYDSNRWYLCQICLFSCPKASSIAPLTLDFQLDRTTASRFLSFLALVPRYQIFRLRELKLLLHNPKISPAPQVCPSCMLLTRKHQATSTQLSQYLPYIKRKVTPSVVHQSSTDSLIQRFSGQLQKCIHTAWQPRGLGVLVSP